MCERLKNQNSERICFLVGESGCEEILGLKKRTDFGVVR